MQICLPDALLTLDICQGHPNRCGWEKLNGRQAITAGRSRQSTQRTCDLAKVPNDSNYPAAQPTAQRRSVQSPLTGPVICLTKVLMDHSLRDRSSWIITAKASWALCWHAVNFMELGQSGSWDQKQTGHCVDMLSIFGVRSKRVMRSKASWVLYWHAVSLWS